MTSADFYFENKHWKNGLENVAGVDEVGRGSFAGPVVASAVVFSPQYEIGIRNNELGIRIDDSKKLTRTRLQREKADIWIRQNAITWGIGEASAKIINRLGMTCATNIAFRKAVKAANNNVANKINYLLIDAYFIPYIRGIPKCHQHAIIKGDEKSYSIAAASILAKVYRDVLMKKIGRRKNYKKYDWINNKGYGTKYHREAILTYGITGYHRKQFVETYLRNRMQA